MVLLPITFMLTEKQMLLEPALSVSVRRVPRIAALYAIEAAIRYALPRWTALTRHVDDGQLEIDNNAAERSAKLNGVCPEICLQHVLEHLADHPISKIDELLPWLVSSTTQTAPPSHYVSTKPYVETWL